MEYPCFVSCFGWRRDDCLWTPPRHTIQLNNNTCPQFLVLPCALRCQSTSWMGCDVSCLLSWASQFAIMAGSNVSLSSNTSFTCPVASNFQDTYGGLFGNGAYATTSSYCLDGLQIVNGAPVDYPSRILTSTLEFQCQVCGTATSHGSTGTTDVPCVVLSV